ncbi:FAD-dependent oxidoreductase [Tunturiibacter gelidiferens]|uniref:FAD-dependent oxidoreductase n=1 Tax=Tunturiibacter gelidiferens TaxID=3069689 RepID=UPI003D9BC458
MKTQSHSQARALLLRAHMEAQLCDSAEVIVVGGGNSARQAAAFLAQSPAKVHLFVRSQKLSDSMSQYLIGRIKAHPRIEIHYRTRITGFSGPGTSNGETALEETKSGSIRHVFVMAGAARPTESLLSWTIGVSSSLTPILRASTVVTSGRQSCFHSCLKPASLRLATHEQDA